MRSITKLLTLSRRLPHRGALRSFSETPNPNPRISLRLSSEEIEKYESEKLERGTFIDLARRLTDPSNPASAALSDRLQKEFASLFSADDASASVTKEFESTRNLNRANHELINLMRQKYHKNQEDLRTMHDRLAAKMAIEKEAAEKKFALSLISTISTLLGNAEKIQGMKEKGNDDLVYNTLEGIKMIEQNAVGVLRRFGVTQVPVQTGDPVNPELHVLAGGKEAKKGGKVKRVVKQGFKMKEKVIAKAEVEVA
jgi:molecular chaperone GrpE (heat shock protein)